jgi:hypothetical protein
MHHFDDVIAPLPIDAVRNLLQELMEKAIEIVMAQNIVLQLPRPNFLNRGHSIFII